MKKYHAQKGSAHAVVVICLVLALITALGWIFWQNFIHKEPTKNDTKLLVVQKKDENKDSSTTPGETTNTKYLVVKEWGVRFPYVNEDTFSYTMQGQSNVISIVSKKLADEQGGLCKTQGGGSIERAQAADPFRKGSSGPAAAFPSYQVAHGDSVNGIGKVDNYYFGYIPNNGPNCEGDESVGKEVQQIVSRVEQAR